MHLLLVGLEHARRARGARRARLGSSKVSGPPLWVASRSGALHFELVSTMPELVPRVARLASCRFHRERDSFNPVGLHRGPPQGLPVLSAFLCGQKKARLGSISRCRFPHRSEARLAESVHDVSLVQNSKRTRITRMGEPPCRMSWVPRCATFRTVCSYTSRRGSSEKAAHPAGIQQAARLSCRFSGSMRLPECLEPCHLCACLAVLLVVVLALEEQAKKRRGSRRPSVAVRLPWPGPFRICQGRTPPKC